ncbi:MAG TPA: Spy/CpxP family protein refolding chaperone [Magnetospirillaceae bacterium]|jgi:hypothetical protein
MNAERKIFGLRAVAASAALSTALLFAASSYAADATTQAPADNSQAAPAAPAQAAAPAAGKHEDRVDARIKELHAKLHITEAQKPQWDAYVQTLRDNAAAMDQGSQQLSDAAKARMTKAKMTALDDLKAYEQFADAKANVDQQHSEGLKKLVPAFEALYNTMSDHQKKITDRMFDEARRMHEAKMQQHAKG